MRFLYNTPAILHRDALVIGDTHFGMEEKLRKKGIYNSALSEQLFWRAKRLLLEYKPKKLILLGDVKENITTLDETTNNILSRLSMLAEVIIVKGNHDGSISEKNAQIVGPEGFVYCGVALAHGHAWPAEELMRCKTLVVAHQHPLITLTDRSGKRHNEAVWLFAECNAKKISKYYKSFNPNIKLVLLPAFNPLIGSPLNSSTKTHLGPLLNNKLFKVNDALLSKLDGTSLGRLKNLKM
jgi:putative SbcD/Mre11-related phosphoesterase